jgi:hypothetical protein
VARLEAGGVAVEGQGEKAPWERRAELGVVAAWFQTIKAVMSSPSTFFERLDKSVTTYECLWVPVINQTLVGISAWLVQLTLVGAMGYVAPTKPGQFDPMMFFAGGLGFLQVVIAPFAAVISVFIAAGLTHLCLAVTKNARASFHQTMRGVCYAQSPGVLGVIPFVGGLVGFVWMVVAQIFMVIKIHRTSGGMAALAVLWWYLLAFCCAGVVFFTVLAATVGHK